MDCITLTDCILEILYSTGEEAARADTVTLLEHSLQAACLAEQGGAPDSLVVAALLHDLGHLINSTGEVDCKDASVSHEELAAAWLSIGFSRAVTQPIRLHVAAKRYFSAVEPNYTRRLSASAQAHLPLQGGPMCPEEIETFKRTPWARDALVLRLWDDAARVPGRVVPDLAHYRPHIVRQLDLS